VPFNYEMGTNKNDVDFEWIPRNNLGLKIKSFNKNCFQILFLNNNF
jgi:hypothetical protein